VLKFCNLSTIHTSQIYFYFKTLRIIDHKLANRNNKQTNDECEEYSAVPEYKSY